MYDRRRQECDKHDGGCHFDSTAFNFLVDFVVPSAFDTTRCF
jgi:hypothetical protein